MLSVPDMALLGAAALLLFGPEQLPRVARKAGNVMRDIQNTSQAFIREMERAADIAEASEGKPAETVPYEPAPYAASAFEAVDPLESSAAPGFTARSNGSAAGYEPAPPDPEPPATERLAQPRPALDLQTAEHEHGAEPFDPPPRA